MPSSPGPNDYKRTLQRFFYKGISLLPQDALPDGKQAWGRNIRSYQPGTIEPRYGLNQLTETPFADLPHSIFRLNDETPYGELGAPSRRFIGAGTVLYGGSPDAISYGIVDPSPYSGNPFTFIAAQPINSPRPFVYIGDSVRLRKVNSSFNDYPIGLAQPTIPPAAALAAPELTFLDTIPTAAWVEYGGDTTGFATVNRVDGTAVTVTQLLYDDGAAPGMASVSLSDFNNVTAGMTLDIGAAPETVIVRAVHPPVSPTTIAGIMYDSGNTGLCVIQPTGSFSVGQIEAALPAEYDKRFRDLNEPLPPRVTITRTVDFPVDSLVQLGGTETVRILSVAIGPDGVQSFRCFTFGTFAAGATITGLPSFRAYFNTTKNVGDPAQSTAFQVTVTPPTDDNAIVGGIQGPLTGNPRNWALVGTRAVQPEDIIRFGIKISLLGFVESVRLVLDASPVGPELLRDYFFYEWRASDLITAIQATAETATGLVSDAQADAVAQGQTDSQYADQYGQASRAVRSAVLETSRGFRSFFGTSDDEANLTERITAAGPVSTGSAISRQLALGNNVWMTLECRVGDLTRVGTDTTLTLGALYNAAFYAQFLGTTTPITFEITDCYLVGGYGPDVGTIMPPYVYRYSYRSTITGERSNPSPPMRAGVTPRRGRVILEATPSQDPQCDLIDWWRFGGALARWEYVNTDVNDPATSPTINTYFDDFADRQIEGGQRIRVDQYQPWPVSDLPRSGTCTVVGTSVEWVSGDLFNVEWAADSLITVNGVTTQLFTSPSSTTRLEIVHNAGNGTAVPFSMPSPTLLAQPIAAHFGGTVNGVWVHFGCGDAANPSILHWTNPNDPDASSDRNTLVVTSASEPLMNGWIDDGIPYVFSAERLYRILPTFGGLSTFQTQETDCTVGLWTPWFFVPDPDGGAYFGRPNGIWHTRGGGDPVNVIGDDLMALFGRDGTNPETIRNLAPIDFTQTTRLRLSIVGKYLYFDYGDINGLGYTLVYDRDVGGWTPDAYLESDPASPPVIPTGVTVRLSEPGPNVYDHILTAEDGHLYEYTSDKITDVLTTINWAIWTPWAHGEDPRAWKQWGDAILDFNPGGSVDGVGVTPVINNGNVALPEVVIGAGGTTRNTYLIELTQGIGLFSRNCGLLIEGGCQSCDIQRPIFYLWEPSYLWKGVSVGRRATDWEDLGYKGAKFVQGVVIRANTFNLPKLLNVEYDGPNNAPQIALPLSILHNGEQSIAYPEADVGWNPFIAELVRLHGVDDVEWVLHDWRFIWEPAPELATQWETQDTTFGLPGFLSAASIVTAYSADEAIELTVWHDLNPVTYGLPATGGEYQRLFQWFGPYKGKAVRFQWTSDLPFRLYKADCSVRVQGWGVPGGYAVMNPFGGPHFADGAGV